MIFCRGCKILSHATPPHTGDTHVSPGNWPRAFILVSRRHPFYGWRRLLVTALTGCNAATQQAIETKTQEPEYELTLESTVDETDCFVCGNPPGGLLDYYSKFDSIGIIYWPDLTVIDTGVRVYDEDGNQVLDGGSSNTRISSFGEGNGSIVCSP